MLLAIHNDHIQVQVDSLGAQLLSVKSSDGCQYLWQGDPKYWGDRAPVLFPIIGRLDGKRYLAKGKEYCMEIHGFAAGTDFTVVHQSGDTLVLSMSSTPATMKAYPFVFTLEITYHLEGHKLLIGSRVVNQDTVPMDFALGGHPGFCVPLEPQECFEDYYLEFDAACQPERIGFTEDTILVDGTTAPYPLAEGRYLPLKHDLFDQDAIILQNMARKVSLKSHRSNRSVTVTYPDMPYLGIWHWPKTDAPYVCIEPWTSLPGRSKVIEDIAGRDDFIHLHPGKEYQNTWTIEITETG